MLAPIQVMEKNNEINVGLKVWIKTKQRPGTEEDDDRVWMHGVVEEIEQGDRVVYAVSPSTKVEDQSECVVLANDEEEDKYDDMLSLRHLHEPGILHHLETRYLRKRPFTFLGSILVVVNPFEEVEEPVDLVGDAKVLGQAHPFSIAEASFEKLEVSNQSQCVVICGESGSGKSEACKRIIRHWGLRACMGSYAVNHQLASLEPIFESFGNAFTRSNHNSSRFGKFTKLCFGDGLQFIGARVETYLLERSRVSYHDHGECNFHVFYQMLAGANIEWLEQFGLRDGHHPQTHLFLAPSLDRKARHDDAKAFKALLHAMETIPKLKEEMKSVFAVIAALIHLGDVHFVDVDSDEGNVASIQDQEPLNQAAKLLALQDGRNLLQRLICEHERELRGERLVTRRNAESARRARDAITRAIYHSLFEWIVSVVNEYIGPESLPSMNGRFLGVLDIFGFEEHDPNGFEQLLINFANEALQTSFNIQVFQGELDLYRREGLVAANDDILASKDVVPSIDSNACMLLLGGEPFSKSKPSVLDTIDTLSAVPEPSDEKILGELNNVFQGHPMFEIPHPKYRKSCFVIVHYAGKVMYTIDGFVEKNIDKMPCNSEHLFGQSTNRFVALLGKFAQESALSKPNIKRQKSTAGKFKQQIGELIKVLDSSQSSFIRCMKPNKDAQPGKFDRRLVVKQLRCLSLTQTAKVLRGGLPVRFQKHEFLAKFPKAKSMTEKHAPRFAEIDDILEVALKALEVGPECYRVGRSMIFFATKGLSQIDHAMKCSPSQDELEDRIRHHWTFISRQTFQRLCNRLMRKAMIIVLRSVANLRRGMQTKAAVVIARTWRMFSLRRTLARYVSASTTIESFWRSTSARRAYFRSLRDMATAKKAISRDAIENDKDKPIGDKESRVIKLEISNGTWNSESHPDKPLPRKEKPPSKHGTSTMDEGYSADADDDEEDSTKRVRPISIRKRNRMREQLDSDVSTSIDENSPISEGMNTLHKKSMSMRFKPGSIRRFKNFKLTGGGSGSSKTMRSDKGMARFPQGRRHSIDFNLTRLLVDLANSSSETTIHRTTSFSSVASGGRNIWQIDEADSEAMKVRCVPKLFRNKQNQKERKVVAKLKKATNTRHIRMLAEGVQEAREMSLKCSEVEHAEAMIATISCIHAQSMLQEAILSNDYELLEEAIAKTYVLGAHEAESETLQQAIDVKKQLEQRKDSIQTA